MSSCFVFTSSFPYSFQETFLETEINYLCNEFDKVYIFAFTSSNRTVRKTPNNVISFSLGLTKFPFKWIRKLAFGLFRKIIPIDKKNFRDKIECWYKRGTVYLATKKVCKIIRRENLSLSNSIFYSYWISDTALTALMVKKELKNSTLKVISRGHGSDVYGYAQKRGFNPFQSYVVSHLDSLFCISNHGLQYLAKLYPDSRSKLIIERLGTKDFGVNFYEKTSQKTIVTCSSLIPLKRVSLFAEAFILLKKLGINIKWVCFGDGSELANIQAMINKSGYEKDAIFYGRKDNNFIMEYYQKNSIYMHVNVSETEGIPVAIMEAMSFGVPCMATNVGGTSEIVDDESGFLIDANISKENLSKQILDALNLEYSVYFKKRMASRSKWDSIYNAEKNYTKWARVLKGIANG